MELFINLFKAWVGAASADAFIHMGVHCWDMAAAALIVKEAGGACLHTDGSEFNLMGRQIVAAASEELAKEIVTKIKIYITFVLPQLLLFKTTIDLLRLINDSSI